MKFKWYVAAVMGGWLLASGAAVGAPATQVVKTLALQTFFNTPQPWELQIHQAVNAGQTLDAAALRVCLVEESAPGKASYQICKSLYGSTPRLPNGAALPLQNFRSAELVLLPGPPGVAQRSTLLVRAAFVGATGTLEGVSLWNYNPALGVFKETFHSAVGSAGAQAFVESGPLAGAFVRVAPVFEGDEANQAAPVHYLLSVYEPAPRGYVQVLSLLTPQRYPSGLPNAIASFTPLLAQALQAVYPHGVTALQR